MARKITLDGAKAIFTDVDFQELRMNETVVGYRAKFGDQILEDALLRELCRRLWEVAAEAAKTFQY